MNTVRLRQLFGQQSRNSKWGGDRSSVSIGRPIANASVFILDARQRPVPAGFAGELYIGGVGVARGYFNQADQTAEKFLPNPFDNHSGTFMYRTGDRVRYRENGELEYLGRVDNQIKIRGYRVEPEEIETALLTHPAVREAVVILETTALDEVKIEPDGPSTETLAASLSRLPVDDADALLAEIEQLSRIEPVQALQAGEDIT